MLNHDHSRAARSERRLARARVPGQTGGMHTSLDHLPIGQG